MCFDEMYSLFRMMPKSYHTGEKYKTKVMNMTFNGTQIDWISSEILGFPKRWLELLRFVDMKEEGLLTESEKIDLLKKHLPLKLRRVLVHALVE